MDSPEGAAEPITMQPIGTIRSSFPDRFGIPRQPGLIPAARARIELDPAMPDDVVRGLEGFSHVWVVFLFHQVDRWKPLVRPPRLGGTEKRGVFATRSPYRPNRIGLSLVRLLSIDRHPVVLHAEGGDFVDGTPVLDLKPYLPYAEAVPDALADWAQDSPPVLPVDVPDELDRILCAYEAAHPGLRALSEQVLAADPRPAYASARTGRYVVRVGPVDLRFSVNEGRVALLEVIDVVGRARRDP